MSQIINVADDAKTTLRHLADLIASSKKILVVAGAGISTSSGIPDFRSNGGIYSQAASQLKSSSSRPKSERVGKSQGRDIFDATMLRSSETRSAHLKFIADMKCISSQIKQYSLTHRFMRLLRENKKLVRVYTQNIDGLEKRVGLCTNLESGTGSRSRFARKSRKSQSERGDSPSPIDGGCEAVTLHGDLDSLRCPVCQTTVPWQTNTQTNMMLRGQSPPCPSCSQRNESRIAAGRRQLTVGSLRPNIVLYGEEHPSSGHLESLIHYDLRTSPDILLIFGTSLKVYGLQKLVKEFARSVHSRKNGARKVIFVNRTEPSPSMWNGVIDYYVKMDCDDFIDQIRRARPEIWSLQQTLTSKSRKSGRGTRGAPLGAVQKQAIFGKQLEGPRPPLGERDPGRKPGLAVQEPEKESKSLHYFVKDFLKSRKRDFSVFSEQSIRTAPSKKQKIVAAEVSTPSENASVEDASTPRSYEVVEEEPIVVIETRKSKRKRATDEQEENTVPRQIPDTVRVEQNNIKSAIDIGPIRTTQRIASRRYQPTMSVMSTTSSVEKLAEEYKQLQQAFGMSNTHEKVKRAIAVATYKPPSRA